MVTLGRKLRRPEISPGDDHLSCGHMPHLIHSFPLLIMVPASKHSWQNSMPTHAPPYHTPHPQSEVAHTFGLPAMAAVDTLISTRLTLTLTAPYSIPLCIFSLFVPLFRFFMIAYLRTSHYIIFFGL